MSQQRKYQHLTDDQIASFMKYGYLRLENCFSKEQAAEWTKDVWTRLGFDPNDKSTWTRERTNMPAHHNVPVSQFAPKAWNAICELCGGEDRVAPWSDKWNDALIVNLGSKEYEGKTVDPKTLPGWHVDGDFFVHFLDSPEQGLLVIPLFTDIVADGGGTVICPEGVGEIARYLHKHPEGVSPRMVPLALSKPDEGLEFYSKLVQSCSEFHEMTGRVGDVILLHPLMVHSASKNPLRMPRMITNPPVSLRAPFNFDRGPGDGEYSLVELKTLKELGVKRLGGWKISGKREKVVPERVRVQEEMKREEMRRLAAMEIGNEVERGREMGVAA